MFQAPFAGSFSTALLRIRVIQLDGNKAYDALLPALLAVFQRRGINDAGVDPQLFRCDVHPKVREVCGLVILEGLKPLS